MRDLFYMILFHHKILFPDSCSEQSFLPAYKSRSIVTRVYLPRRNIATLKMRRDRISRSLLLTNQGFGIILSGIPDSGRSMTAKERSMKLIFILMRTVLYLRFFFHKFSATGSFGKNPARYESFLPTIEGNPIKAGLFRHHVRQFHESSCSVASVACVVNALLESQGRLPGTTVSQQDLLNRVTTAHWKERMGPNGYRGRRGLPLPELGQVVTASLKVFNISHQGVEVVPATRDPEKPLFTCEPSNPAWNGLNAQATASSSPTLIRAV